MRILVGIWEVAGYYRNLTIGFRRLGIEADLLTAIPSRFYYGEVGKLNPLFRTWRRVSTKFILSFRQGHLINTIFWGLVYSTILCVLLPFIICRYDVIIFGFGLTFTNTSLELWLYKKMGIKIIFVFNGSDSRPPYIDGSFMYKGSPYTLESVRKLTSAQKKKIERIDHFADIVINAIPQAHFHSRSFINVLILGLPYDLTSHVPVFEKDPVDKQVRILHSPSHEEGKGTRQFYEIIERLRTKGYDIKLVVISGMPNAQVIEELKKCDFVLDELYSDTPMAGLAAEAAQFGKPTVVGGYYANQVNEYNDAEDMPPTLFVHPDNIESAIEKMIVDRDFRIDLGRRAYEFVHSFWMPEHVAAKYLQIINNDFPKKWLCETKNIRYVHGWGLPEWRVREVIRMMIENYGVKSLKLDDKPELEKNFIQFAGSN